MTSDEVWRLLEVASQNKDADPGDGGGTTTALSYRILRYGEVEGSISIHTYNSGFSGHGCQLWHRTTSDRCPVVWREDDLGIVTGAEWLPEELVLWLQGR